VSAEVICGRCRGANRPHAARCWVCAAPLDGGTAAPRSWGMTLLKIVLISLAIIAAIPVLLFITCVGIVLVAR
jgi:hypothetical protein